MVPGNPGHHLGCAGLAQAQEFGGVLTEIMLSFLYVAACVAVPLSILILINAWWGR